MSPEQPKVTIIPSRPLLAAGRENRLDVLIRIAAPEAEPRRQRRLLNLGFVLDRSGSMQGDKLRHAAEAVAFAVRNMQPEDRVSLTIYDTSVQTLVPSAPVSVAGPAILEALPQIRAGKSTALHDGWVQGGLQVTEHFDPGRVNRVLLVSDGLANVGETSSDVLIARARGLFERGVGTSTVGVGIDFNEDLMVPMAREAGGAGWFVESPADFSRIFRAELEDLAALFGDRARLRLESRGPRVEILEVINGFPVDDGWHTLGAICSGSPFEIVARVRVRGGEIHQPIDLFDVRLSWEVPGQGRAEMQQLFRMECDDPEKVAALAVNPEVDRVVELLNAARARRHAVDLMDAGQFVAARAQYLDQEVLWAQRHLDTGDPEALQELQELRALVSAAERAATDPEARKLARKRSVYQSSDRLLRSRRQSDKK